VKIVIIGAGAVGFDLARRISKREHDVYVIENDPERLGAVQERLDCHLVRGNGVSPAVLLDVGLEDCDVFAAVTNQDEMNIIACLTARRLGAHFLAARVRHDDYYINGKLMLDGIDLVINPPLEAVRRVREILFQSAASDFLEFAGGRVRIVGTRVQASAPAAGHSLAELAAEALEPLALVTTIVRGEQTLIPHGDSVIQPDDQIYLTGQQDLIDRTLPFFHADDEPITKVMIVGANTLGLELARSLLASGVKVKLIDQNEQKCRVASEQLSNALVLHGDGTDADLLGSEGVREMGGFVSVSNEEESNIMACLLARYHGAGKTVCRVNRAHYAPLLPLIGIDAAISPRLSTAARIARAVMSSDVIAAKSLGFSDSRILQVRLHTDCPRLGRPLADIGFPRSAVLAALLKSNRVITPRGDTVLEAGDEVIVFALPSGVAEVERFFAIE